MKKLFVVLVFVLLAATSCDFSFLASAPAPEPYAPASDADFESFTGERLEKYYYVVDPIVYDKRIPLIESPRVTIGSGQYNQYTIANVPLRALFEDIPFSPEITGTIVTIYRTTLGSSRYQLSIKDILRTSPTLNLYSMPEFFAQTHEPYAELKAFNSSSLMLPKTGGYSNSFYQYQYRKYAVTLYTSHMQSICETYYNGQEILGYNWAETLSFDDVGFTSYPFEIFEPFILKSRDFYQYKNFTLKYAPDLKVIGFICHPIVESHSFDPDANVLTVVFKDYDQPYIGSVISYWIQAEDGTVVEKTVSIGG
jgi:hypothetical protein